MNIWVEDGDVMFYVSRSGTFDEKNCQLKQGRVRLRLSPNPFKDAKNFRQELKLKDGYVEIAAGNTQIQFWVDVFHPIIHVEVTNAHHPRAAGDCNPSPLPAADYCVKISAFFPAGLRCQIATPPGCAPFPVNSRK